MPSRGNAGTRHFVERSFEDAKSACGMADYQLRRWQACHHHMTLVMIATMFLAKERLAHRYTAGLLYCRDLVDIMRHKLPLKIVTDEDLAVSIADRHTKRCRAMDSAYRRPAEISSVSNCNAIGQSSINGFELAEHDDRKNVIRVRTP